MAKAKTKKTTRKNRPYCEPGKDTFALIGSANFPYLVKTAKQVKLDAGEALGQYDDDVYKLSVNIDQEEFMKSDLAKEAQRFCDEWYPEKTDVIDGVAGIKDLNDGLEKDDKYYDLSKDKYRITVKRNPNAKRNAAQPRPTIFDEKGEVLTEEQDISRITDGCKVCAIVRPSAYGDYDKLVEYNNGLDACGDDVGKIREYVSKNDKPIFGVNLELFAVQLLEARKGGAPTAAAINAHIQNQTEVSADEIDADDEEVPEAVDAGSQADEDVDLG